MKPKFISTHPTFYLVAPSFGCTTSPYKERLEKALNVFKKLNINIILGENCFKAEGIASSNTPQKRAEELMKAFESNADVILSVGGGELMVEILEYVDFDKIKELPPKWYVGYSDNTNMVYTLTTICNIESIYGPHAASFYSYPLEYDLLDTIKLLQGEKEFKGYPQFQLEDSKLKFPKYKFDHDKIITSMYYTSSFSGILLGGCLDCLSTLCGTKFDHTKEYIQSHKKEGIIFYLEASDYNSVGIRRALTQLKYAGWFNHVSGFLIGRSLQFTNTSFGITPEQAYFDILKELEVPILMNVDIGHISPALPIRNGAYAEIELKENNIYITYKD